MRLIYIGVSLTQNKRPCVARFQRRCYREGMIRALIGLLFPLTLLAQTATIQGIVTDPSGAAVPDAYILAILETTGSARNVSTDAGGRYRIPALPVGTYTIRCKKPGFQ